MTIDESVRQELSEIQKAAMTNLVQNVMPFWMNNAWDNEYGGFLTRLDRTGRRLDSTEKYLMMQVRMLASLSWCHSFGLQEDRYPAMADETFAFISERMWDNNDGGFFFSVERDGHPRSRRKNTDTHAYAITGLAAYYAASKRTDALSLVEKVFELLQIKAKDGDLGYFEDFDGGSWDVLNAEQMHIASDSSLKTIDMHTNLLESFSYLYRATGNERHAEALRDIMALILAKGLDTRNGCTISVFTREWKPVTSVEGYLITSFGLNVELAWLLIEAADAIGKPRAAVQGPSIGLVDHALNFGFAHETGGLAAYGPNDKPTIDARELPQDRLLRLWWSQAELLNALLIAHELLPDNERYLSCLRSEWDWIWRYQIDHEAGDWYQEVDPKLGLPTSSDKGAEWKTSFHTSRALMRTIQGIERIIA